MLNLRPKSNVKDGARLHEDATDKLWLVYGSRRHHVSSSDVFRKLFRGKVFIEPTDPSSINQLTRGDDLLTGTCLVRSDRKVQIYLLAVSERAPLLHPIASVEAFDRFGFDYDLVRDVPDAMIASVKPGLALA